MSSDLVDDRLPPHRLGRSVIPIRYELTLIPDLETACFQGSEEISLEVREPIEVVVLNSAELEIRSARLEDSAGRRIEVVRIEIEETTERARLVLSEAVGKGSYRAHLEFAGTLNDKLRGFYRSRYTDVSGRIQTLAATQFESTEARRAFPCFDEPDLKATFAISLVVEPGLLAVSNSPVLIESVDARGVRTVRFADTMRMSTYLVAFVVGPLEATEPREAGGVPLRVVHPIGQGRLAGYALDVAQAALGFFADYYAIPYPGRKLDLVALPDFAMGAMENLGCVTFREALLLLDPDKATQGELQHSAEVIAHELAHMWFGDLVTMRWWNGIWLNEAFATFMAKKALDAYRPDWQSWTQFSLDRSVAFQVDALESSRPVEYPVESPADAEGMFDVLTYQKGASVLRMLERYLGEERFRRGIRAYLAKHSYGNTDTGDLWRALEGETGEPVERIMTSWIFRQGFPQVRVERSDGGGLAIAAETSAGLRLEQKRFLLTASTASPHRLGGPEGTDTLWAIPLIIRVGRSDGRKAEALRVLLEAERLDLPLQGRPGYVVVNAEAAGYYRVAYDPELFGRLSERLFEELSPVERYSLLDDLWSAVLTAESPAGSFLELSKRFASEDDVDVWKLLAGCLGALSRLVEGEALARLRRLVVRIVAPAFDRVGREPKGGEGPRTVELRGLLAETLCIAGRDEAALQWARAFFERRAAGSDPGEPNLAAAAVAAVAATGTAADHERFVQLSKSAPTPQERLRYLYALASFPGQAEFERTLALSLSGEVKSQNAPFLLGAAMRNRFHGERAWRFVRDHWEATNRVFPPNTIVRMVGGIRALSRRETASEVESFFAAHPIPQGQITLRQHIELMRINVALHERERERFAEELLRTE